MRTGTRVGVLALLLLMMLSACVAANAEVLTYADTIVWDGEYDVIVAGFGGAGAVAAKNAADAGASVLSTEKAPQGDEGGNTRYSHQLFVDGNGDYESTYTYFKALGGDKAAPDAMIEVYAKAIANMADIVAEELEVDRSKFFDWKEKLVSVSPEYPHLPGSDVIHIYSIDGSMANGAVWNAMKQTVMNRLEKIDVWYNSPAKHLIQDPQSKTIVGVQIERDGKLLNIRARNGVVLATGGFENNPEMVATYLGLTNYEVVGSLYNTGDGIKMAQEIGADMWHMEVYEGNPMTMSLVMEEGQHAALQINAAFKTGSSMIVGENGKRFVNEQDGSRHGHVEVGGTWMNPNLPDNFFCFMDAANYAVALENGLSSDYAYTYVGETISEAAIAAGIDAANLEKTVENFNSFVEKGEDIALGRPVSTMVALGDGPYYAIKLVPAVLNTQGGPRRNENMEVLDLGGNVIPHLYTAGELGALCSHHYQGGSNVAETIISGSIAGKNAASEKDGLPEYVIPVKVESAIKYTLGVQNDAAIDAKDGMEVAENELLGEGNGIGGTLIVKVTMDGGAMTAIEVVSHSETQGIADPAIEQIPTAILNAQSVDVDNVSGATITSKAIKAAVADALSQAK